MPESFPPDSPTYTTLSNIGLSAIILITLAAWSYAMFGGSSEIPINKSAVGQEVLARIDKQSPAIEKEAKELTAELAPPLGEAIYRRAQLDSNRYLHEFQQQSGIYFEHADQIFVGAVKAQYRDYLQEHRQVIAEEFPEHADKESIDRLIAKFEQVGESLIDRYYLNDFATEAERTKLAWEKIRPLTPPTAGEPSLEEQLLEYGTDWSVLAFTDEAQQRVIN
ncbi:hypothetical protein DTL42_23685 [Bremerella cremea]|uniref:Uncharacterized protein n=1 Tax=Bremerella cremea TaxID=1031537 RepID=A0A368KL91_9BACT|nr:hypothetical protein [Bremerella cremea]RCS40387.1 hypothetical protein DTL42_23685 [Bremerella cremea]